MPSLIPFFCRVILFQATFEDCFAKQYAIIHRLETNKLRNVAKLFAHLLSVDAISWGVLGCIRLTEDDTTSSSRIFIKYLFQVRACAIWLLTVQL
jgi:pre-mRNA-splicing factor CWC22